MNDSPSAASAPVKQGPPQPASKARFTCDLRQQAAIEAEKSAGVVKPVQPGAKSNGKEPPPARRSALASSSIATTAA